MVKTTFAGKKNIFTGEALRSCKPVDPSSLSISNDPVMDGRAAPVSKYEAIFRKLKPGQCVVCEPQQADKINAALRKWLDQNGFPVNTRATSRYPADGKGRVWRLA